MQKLRHVTVLWHLKRNKAPCLHGLFENMSMSRLWRCDKPHGSFVSFPSDGINVELLCWIPHQCLISPGILIVLFNLPLWRSLINGFKACKSIRRRTWTLDVAGSVSNQTIADVMFSDGFCIEPHLSAVLQILIHLMLTSLLWTVNFASALGGGGGGSEGGCQKVCRGSAADFVCNSTLMTAMLSRRTFAGGG